MYFNGIIVQDLDVEGAVKINGPYKGVMLNWVWPTMSIKEFRALNEELHEYTIYRYCPWAIHREVFAKRYVKACVEGGYRIRVLAIESDMEYYQWDGEIPEMRCLGYECAITQGSYFSFTGYDFDLSCDLSDYPQYKTYREKLNAYGLFDDLATAKECIELRNEFFTDGQLEYYDESAMFVRVSEVLNLV